MANNLGPIPRLLDLFCGAGGAAMGYHNAGFKDITGVDNQPQKNYPFEFVQADALEYLTEHGHEFDAIHASPECKGYSNLAAMHPDRIYEKLIEATREALVLTRRPYVIENVETSTLVRQPSLDGRWGVCLCGSMFGLGARENEYLRRHRLFETSWPVHQLDCRHGGRLAIGVYGHGGYSGKHRMAYKTEASEAMGIDWMKRDELTQAVPPAYTEYVGAALLPLI